jgi:glycerol transport system ATP-binding protein
VAAILLDEPLTVIDPHVKWLLRRKLKQVHEQLKMTLVYVTHDQVEALTLADRVVVMNQGRVVQVGTPQELFERPADTFVGYFIGSPGMNLLPCTVEDGAVVVEGQRLPLDAGVCARARAAGGEPRLGIRPEFLRRVPEGTPCSVRVEVTQVEDLGRYRLATARLGAQALKVRLPEEERLAPGEVCWLELPPRWTTLYAGGRAIP